MAINMFNVNSRGKNILRVGEAACLACGKKLSYCGKPFSADIACPNCGVGNFYRESQKPESVRVLATS
jgi:predicted RNA-binding Zn-ribbon protein involved in translation (DUF1610 family)